LIYCQNIILKEKRLIQEQLNKYLLFSFRIDFIMKVTDNGVGFDEKMKIRQDSYGLIGMKERVYLLDGKLTVTGKQVIGTTVFLLKCHIKYKISFGNFVY